MAERFVLSGQKLLTKEQYSTPSSSVDNMCDRCGIRISILRRKTCFDCRYHFCGSCVIGSTRGDYICHKCQVFSCPVMERSQLELLSTSDLKYYTTKHDIQTAITWTFIDLINVILTRQANILSQKANMAIAQLNNVPPGVDFSNIANSELAGPYSSAYSSSGTGGNERTGGATTTDGELYIRKRKKQGVDLANVSSVDELDQQEEISELSVKQLKIILQRNCVNYKGCVEKAELADKVRTLWKARQEEKKLEAKINETGDTAAESEFMCKVCMDAPVDCVLLECGHMLTCVRCGRQLAECPICRQYVTRVVHAFRV